MFVTFAIGGNEMKQKQGPQDVVGAGERLSIEEWGKAESVYEYEAESYARFSLQLMMLDYAKFCCSWVLVMCGAWLT